MENAHNTPSTWADGSSSNGAYIGHEWQQPGTFIDPAELVNGNLTGSVREGAPAPSSHNNRHFPIAGEFVPNTADIESFFLQLNMPDEECFKKIANGVLEMGKKEIQQRDQLNEEEVGRFGAYLHNPTEMNNIILKAVIQRQQLTELTTAAHLLAGACRHLIRNSEPYLQGSLSLDWWEFQQWLAVFELLVPSVMNLSKRWEQ